MPVMPMHDLESILEDPHLVATDFFPVVHHPSEGNIRSMKAGARPGRRPPAEPTRLAPRLNEHGAEILHEAGFSADEIAALVRDGVTMARWPGGLRTMDFALSANQESIRDAVAKICARFDDAYWLKKDKEGGFPADFHKALGGCRLARHLHSRRLWRFGARHCRCRDHDAHDRGIRRRHVGCFRRAHERVRAQSGSRVRHRGAVPADAAADRRGHAAVVLCRHRAEYRAQHHAAENPRGAQGRQICRQRPEGLDLDRAGRRKDSAAGAHHAAGGGQEPDARLEPVLYRFRSQPHRGARDREDGPQGGRFQRTLHREFRNSG